MKLHRLNNLRRSALTISFVAGSATCLAAAPTTQPEVNASDYYLRASEALKTDGPSESIFSFRDYPPFGAKWDELAKASWEQNAEARRLVHEAKDINTAHWPLSADNDLHVWDYVRRDANEIGDTALYQHFQHDDAGALNTLDDLDHLVDLLQKDITPHTLMQQLVAIGIDSLITDRLHLIFSDSRLSDHPNDTHAISISTARNLITRLLKDRVTPDRVLAGIGKVGPLAVFIGPDDGRNRERVIEDVNRINADHALAAMLLACHLFQFDHHRWPTSLQKLVPTYLPAVPLDPWGDGKQTLGYALIKAGLPDGSDRPLVYHREADSNGDILFFRTDRPVIGYCNPFLKTASGKFRFGGQFRDVTAWVPVPDVEKTPTTQPLQ